MHSLCDLSREVLAELQRSRFQFDGVQTLHAVCFQTEMIDYIRNFIIVLNLWNIHNLIYSVFSKFQKLNEIFHRNRSFSQKFVFFCQKSAFTYRNNFFVSQNYAFYPEIGFLVSKNFISVSLDTKVFIPHFS